MTQTLQATSDVCPNSHIRTEANTRWVKRGRGDQMKRTCLDCRKLRNTGTPGAHQLQAQLTSDRHEDIEDLLRFGATFEEIVQRAGFSTWKRMKASLSRRGRHDLIGQLEQRRGAIENQSILPRGLPGTRSKGHNRPIYEKAHELPEGLHIDWQGNLTTAPDTAHWKERRTA